MVSPNQSLLPRLWSWKSKTCINRLGLPLLRRFLLTDSRTLPFATNHLTITLTLHLAHRYITVKNIDRLFRYRCEV